MGLFGLLLVGFPILGGVLGALQVVESQAISLFVFASPPATAWGWMEICRGGRLWRVEAGAYGWPALWLLLTLLLALLLTPALARRWEEERGEGPRFR